LAAHLVLAPPLVGIPTVLISVVVIVEEPLSLTHQVILLRIRRWAEGDHWTGCQETRSHDCCETHLRAPFSLSRLNARYLLEFAARRSIRSLMID